MPKSTFLDDTFLNAALRNIAFVPPPVVYLALYTTAPTPAGGGVEVAGNGYGRQTVIFTVPVNGTCSNFADIIFPVATAGWGTVVAFGVFDAASGGNLLYFGSLSAPRTILVNDQMKFPSGQLIASEA